MKKHIATVAKFAVTLAAFGWVVHSVEAEHMLEMLARQNQLLLGATALLLLAQIFTGGVRWRIILHMLDPAIEFLLPFWRGLKLFYISIFFNTCLPGTIGGDVIRVFLCRAEKLSTPLAIHSVILDRVVTLLALLVMTLFGLPMLGKAVGLSGWVLIAVAIVCGIGGLIVLLSLHKLPANIRETKIGHAMMQLSDSARQLMRTPLPFLTILLMAAAAHAFYCIAAYWLAQSLGVPMTIAQSFKLIPLVMLLAVLPISFGGWGLREAGMVGVLALIGVPKAAALVLSVQLGLLTIAISLPAGIMWLLTRKPAAQNDA